MFAVIPSDLEGPLLVCLRLPCCAHPPRHNLLQHFITLREKRKEKKRKEERKEEKKKRTTLSLFDSQPFCLFSDCFYYYLVR